MQIFKRTGFLLALAISALTTTACVGPQVEVPPAYVGKITTDSGFQEGIIPPSRFRLEGMCMICDGLVLVEASDVAQKEQMKIYMPKDELNLTVDVRGVFTISSEESNAEKIFDRVTAQPSNMGDRVSVIPMTRVYETYGQAVLREAVRTTLTKYTIAQVMENRESIGTELTQIVRKKLSATPITTKQFGLADIQPPAVIVAAREAAKEREIAIQREEAEKQIKLKRAEADLQVAVKQQEVDLKEAETQVLVNKTLAEGVNKAFVTQRWLKIMAELAANPDGKVIIMPAEAMQNPALMMGSMQHSFK